MPASSKRRGTLRRLGAAIGAALLATGAVAARVEPSALILLDAVAHGNRLAAVGERGTVLLSYDAGRSWRAQASGTTRTLTAAAFVDGQTAVAVGHGASIVRTSDGGQSWAPVAVPEAGQDSLLGVVRLPWGALVAHGAFGLYLESNDAGRTWVRRQIVAPDFDRHVYRVLAVGDRLLLVGESGTMAVSTDRGLQWRAVDSPYRGSLFGALLARDGALLVYGMRGHVFRSADGGARWTRIEIDSTLAINNGRLLADGRVALVGNNGLVAISADDGRSFVRRTAAAGTHLAQVVDVTGGGLLVVGEAGVSRVGAAGGLQR